MARFEGRVLLVTGGGSGIAAATARAFAAEGGRVAIADLDITRAREVAAELGESVALEVDVSDEAQVQSAVAEAAGRLGRIDCVLNAAGFADAAPIDEYSYDRWTKMLAVHAGGTFLVCKHTIPFLRRVSGGAIVNVASTAAVQAQWGNFAYGAAKGAVVAFSRQLALEVAPEIRVNAVAPGRTRTPLMESAIYRRGGGDYEEGMRISASAQMLNRIAEPAEIGNLILFLLSAESSYLTAGLYVADGGDTAF